MNIGSKEKQKPQNVSYSRETDQQDFDDYVSDSNDGVSLIADESEVVVVDDIAADEDLPPLVSRELKLVAEMPAVYVNIVVIIGFRILRSDSSTLLIFGI